MKIRPLHDRVVVRRKEEETKTAAFERSSGRRECVRTSCSNHYLACCGSLVTLTTAQFHHKRDHPLSGTDALSNCEVLCVICNNQAEMDLYSPEYT